MRNIRTSLLAGVLFALFCVCNAHGASLNLAPNRTTRINAVGKIEKVMVSNPKVADAHVADDGRSVVVTALSKGTCEIRIVRSRAKDLVYDLTVRTDLSNMAAEIEELLSDVEGIKVKVVGDRIVLDGKLVVKSDYDRVNQIASAYKGLILNLSKLDRTDFNKYVAQAIQRDIALRTVTVKVSGETATLEGIVFDPADKTMAVEKAKQRCSRVVNLLKVEEVMIETDVLFIMVDTGKGSSSGFNILKTLSLSASITSSDSGTKYSVAGNLQAAIKALVDDNKAKIVSQQHLSTKSGGTGSMSAGGEQYFEVAGQVGGSLEKVEYGTVLKVKPALRGQDRVVNEISLEISAPSAKPRGVFGLEKYKTANTTMCKIGESIVISGLSQSLENQFRESTPLLGRLPIIGLFFSEKGKRRTNKELVVLITPRPVFPTDMSDKPAFSEKSKRLLED